MPEAKRNGRVFTREITDGEAWGKLPSAREEARHLLAMLGRNGDDVESLRRLILVSDAERGELLQWAAESPALSDRIEAAIRFRAEVLRAFDGLVAETQSMGTNVSQGENAHENSHIAEARGAIS